MDERQKRILILIVGLICICAFLYFIFVAGAGYNCYKSGGTLAKNIYGMRCINISAVDLCRDYTGRILEKKTNPFNFTFNSSEYNISSMR